MICFIFRDSFDIPLDQMSILITTNFLTQLLVGMLANQFVDRTVYKVSIDLL